MANMIDYLIWRGDLLMEQVPFCQVDGLIFSQLAYTQLQDVVPGEFSTAGAAVETVAAKVLADESRLKDPAEDKKLWELARTSCRCKDLQLTGYVDHFDIEAEKQFSAVTVLLPGKQAVVVFRGTDLTIVGWKEDFNMSFSDCVPAQLEGVQYIEAAAKALPDYTFYICGHSKGGNLAVYAAAFCDAAVQERILGVVNFDGPGFSEENAAKPGMKRVMDRTKTFLPQSSVVGMLLEHEEPFTVIRSKSLGLLQHDPYTWTVLGPAFVVEEETTSSSQFIDQTLKNWLKSMSKEKREGFVETVFSILDDCEAVTLHELFSGKNALAVVKALTQMEKEERQLIQEGLDILKDSMKNSFPLKLEREREK